MIRARLYIIIYIIAASFLTACHHHHHEEEPKMKAKPMTVIFYIAGQNSLNPELQTNIDSLTASREVIPDSCNVIIFRDSPDKCTIMRLTAEEGLSTMHTYFENVNSCDSTAMLEVLQRIIRQFPANHYALTFASHATGWVPRKSPRKTFGIDRSQLTADGQNYMSMNISELQWVLEHLPHFDYIFFDACFMQDIEIAYELRHRTDWLIGSPAEIPAPGAPYDKRMLKALCTSDIEGIVNAYHDNFPNRRTWMLGEVPISAIRSASLESLARATRRYVPTLFADRTNVHTEGFQPHCDYARDWERTPEYLDYSYRFDMKTTMFRLLSEGEFAEWETAYEAAVPYHPSITSWYANHCLHSTIADPVHYGSVTMFVPLDEYNRTGLNENFHQTQWYEAAGWNETGW